ncbi:MAG TPA: hypothetical protein DD390_07880 [Rhodospirillaceae bacterium]|nr:hypothetical protein [Rhodospirillaceae bacterium]
MTRKDGAVLLRRRAETGLLGGMMEIPSTNWTEQHSMNFEETGLPLLSAAFHDAGEIRHTFTHFHLELRVLMTQASGDWADESQMPKDCLWCLPDALEERALPTVMRKIAKVALTAK